MKLKKTLCSVCSFALLCTAALAADTPSHDPEGRASSGALTPPPDAVQSEAPAYELHQAPVLPVLVWGTVAVEGDRVLVTNDNEGASYPEILLTVSEETAILDAVTGAARTLEDLRDGEIVYAYAGPAMTRSLPPQAHAAVLLCNFPADFAAPTYAEVQRVTPGKDGGVSLLMTGEIVLHLNADTELLSSGAEGVPALEDIRPGTRLLSWYSVVMESFPAQAVPDKVLVFPYGYAGYTSMSADSVSVNGETLDAAPYVEAGKLMVPLRDFAEALGCSVAWDAETGTAEVLKDGVSLYALRPGEDTAVREGDMVVALTVPARIRNGLTYAAADDLISWHGLKLVGSWPVV